MRESLKPLPKRKQSFEWKKKVSKGVVSQGDWEKEQFRTQSYKPK